MRYSSVLIYLCILLPVFFSSELIHADTSKDTYEQLEAMISAPDTALPDTDFKVYVQGAIIDGGSFDVFAYSLYEDAEWSYDANHMVVVTSGTLIDADGFNFGSEYANTYTLNKPMGTYKYTFIFGYRTSGHDFYDLAVEIEVAVGEGLSTLITNSSTVSEGGGIVNYTLIAGTSNANRNYLVLGSVSGTEPGILLPGGTVTLPLNWDAFTVLVLALANTAIFQNFMGTLEADGNATATFNAPSVPGATGLVLHFAYALNKPWDFVSNPVAIEIVP